MTLYVTRSVGCDGPDCDNECEGFPGERAAKVRAVARAAGWTRADGHDYCPLHHAAPTGQEPDRGE